jgi:hypothetical protein
MNEELSKLDQERLKLDLYPTSLFVRPQHFAEIAKKCGSHEKLYEYFKEKFEEEKKTDTFLNLHSLFTRWFNDYFAEFNYFGLPQEECVAKYADKYFEYFYLDQVTLMSSFLYPGFIDSFEIVDNVGYKDILSKSSVVFAIGHNGPHLFTPFFFHALGYPVTFSGGFGSHIEKGVNEYQKAFGINIEASFVKFDDFYFENCKKKLEAGSNLLIYPEYSRSPRVGNLTTDFFNTKIHVPCGAIRLGDQFKLPVILIYMKKVNNKYQIVFDSVYYPVKFKFLKGRKKVYNEIQENSLKLFESLRSEIYTNPDYWEGWRYYNIMRENTKKALSPNSEAE